MNVLVKSEIFKNESNKTLKVLMFAINYSLQR